MNLKEYYKNNLFNYLTEARRRARLPPMPENERAGDISVPYKTPRDILDIMSRSAGDDTIDHSDVNPINMKGVEEEDITPAMRAERERSAQILAGVKAAQDMSTKPTGALRLGAVLGQSKGDIENRQYSDDEIAQIIHKKGISTKSGEPLHRVEVNRIAKEALEKVKKELMNSQREE
jgi:hypothetical protein